MTTIRTTTALMMSTQGVRCTGACGIAAAGE
jgi:NADH:ubiquinone oxidoreductase subunit E